MRFHISRWNYWYGYLAIILFAVISIWQYDKGKDTIGIIASLAAAVILIVFEILVRMKQLVIGKNGLFLVEKFANRKTLSKISNVSIQQSFIQQFLGFGDVHFQMGNEKMLLKSFNLPGKIQKALEGR